MSKHKAAQNCNILPWVTEKTDGKEGRFLLVGNSLLLSKVFQSLSVGARQLYLCMALESGGKRNFEFPLASAKKYGIPQTSFRRYVDELIEAKFILRFSNANLRQPNQYEFTSAWKPDNK